MPTTSASSSSCVSLTPFVDYARREAGIIAYITMTGDPAADIAAIAAHYEGRHGKHPELASPIRWLD